MWASYEEGLRGEWSMEDMLELFAETVDKVEYPDFESWVWDMERSATFIRHEG